MKNTLRRSLTMYVLCLGLSVLGLTSCGGNSSPEGRMNEKLESLQKEMLENQKQQNQAILDSLSKIREEINALKHGE